MRKNVFIKSILRQPTRSLLLILLIGLASFAFVLRTVEYVVVRNQIIEISGFYRSIGFLYADTVFGDISQAAEIIRESPHVEFIDQRRTFEGILRDFRNPDFEGMRLWESRENSPRLTDAFFYGELLEIDTGELSETDNMPGQGIVWLRFVIDDVETAYDEHASEGQQLWVRYRHRLREDIGTIADFEVGQRYFIRAFAYFRPGNYGMGVMPVIGRSDPLEIMPLNYEAIAADETDAPLYFIPVSPGERLNFAEIPDLQHLPRLFNEIEHNQRAMILQTTSEMAILPIMQGRPVIRLNDGRLIDYNDNLEGNHVAVINSEFARIRNLQIGDTITLTVPSVQRFDRFFAAFLQSYPEDPGGMFRDLRVTSEFEEVTEVEIELEIVGTYHYAMFGMGGRQTLTIFIPDSIIPDIEILPPLNPVGFQENWQSGHIPDSWFTFTISDSRLEQEFYVEYSEIFQEMGLDLVLLGTDAGNFWASADVIMLIVTFNAVIFWILLIFVLLLVAFLYLRQRSRDLAIMRGLGTSPVVILGRLCVSVLLLGLPAIMVGGVIAWTFGLEAAANTMMPLAQIADVTIVSELHMGWYFVFIGVVFGFALTFTAIGAAFILKSPVLELLQGRIVVFKPRENKKGKVETAEPPKDTKVAGFSFADIDFTEFSKSLKGRIVNSANWIYRHIMRSKLKTILGLSVALLFVVALGWLQEAINRTSAEIDHLYDTTIVFADVRPAQPPSGFVAREVGHLTPGYHISGTVSRHLVNQIRQRPY
ncbi:MAG: hypothetical protein FWD01_04815, partial [Defluviitaleaceae bacterium]|nr:hypothetical protein [Defluviitaleaceae bacterium]